jgi:hypothetical protein
MEAYPRPTAVPHSRHLHPDGADACLDVAFWQITVADDCLPSLGIMPLSLPCQQHGDFDLDCVG